MELDDPLLYINRELSWLGFNRRVLRRGSGPPHPSLQKLKFAPFSAPTLNEYFMVRSAVFFRLLNADVGGIIPAAGRSGSSSRNYRKACGAWLPNTTDASWTRCCPDSRK